VNLYLGIETRVFLNMSEVVIDRSKELPQRKIPMGRLASEDDLKGAAVFLASDASDFVAGHVLAVDRGQSA
jgi:NAD(P)-dependent dehydrogenase (short-subunit alcohol dehydrogenase family)